MFGIKIEPKRIFQMMKGFGISIETLIPQLESTLKVEFQKMESEAGSKLMAVAALDETESHFVISLYKTAGNGELEQWKEFPLKDISKILKNLENPQENDKTFEAQPVAQIGNGNNSERPAYTGVTTAIPRATRPTEPEPTAE